MKFTQRIAVRYLRTKFKLLSSLSKKKAAKQAFHLFCRPQRRLLNPLPKIFTIAESLQLQLGGIRLQGWRWNYPASRKVMILHGFESSVTNFERYIEPLINKGYEVLAFDAPAHGRSSGTIITAPLYKDAILAIVRQYGPVDAFIAHSFGGLAVSLALEELAHHNSLQLVLVAAATETTTAIELFFKALNLDKAVLPEFENIIVRKGGVKPEWYSIHRAMKRIKASILWVQDEDDQVTPLKDVLNIKKENYPNIRFVFTKGLGHRRIYRDQQVMQEIIDFL